jgi:plasmid maintenance system antidote protein VapI
MDRENMFGYPSRSPVQPVHRAISPETALRLGRYLGTGAQFWMNLQVNYDLALAQQELAETIDREVEAA